jgi:DNA repair protein RecO (recombination protein O)
MIVTTPGIVLSRRPLGESDKLAMVYTRDLGRVALRFVGVLRPRAKLRALSEPFTIADYRLFVKPASEYGKCIGGSLRTVHPSIRADYDKTLMAFHFCELLERLTPYRDPNPRKFDLLEQALSLLGLGGGELLPLAYGLRVLDLAGHRTPPPSVSDAADWAWLHDAPLDAAAALRLDTDKLARFRAQLERQLGSLLDWPLKTATYAFVHPALS